MMTSKYKLKHINITKSLNYVPAKKPGNLEMVCSAECPDSFLYKQCINLQHVWTDNRVTRNNLHFQQQSELDLCFLLVQVIQSIQYYNYTLYF